MASASVTTAITASCACGTFKLALSIPSSSLPHECAFCVCDSCRRLSGTCGTTYLSLPTSQTIDPTSFSLTVYPTSTRIVRYFCSTCGAHTVANTPSLGRWAVATGLLDRTEGVLKWMGCKWVEGTLDGGMSVWLNSITNTDGSKRALQRWMLQDGKEGELVPSDALQKYTPPNKQGGEELLKAQCHCGGVKFYITRPKESSKTVYSPFPDLMVPFHSSPPGNPSHEPWFLRANDTKYLAGTCTCTSCRIASGMEIQTWAFVPKCNIFQENGRQMEYDMGTLKRYANSPGVSREFCSVCGATVFWHCEERPDLVDVSMGLLDPEEGARVEGWLDWWTDRVSFEEMAIHRQNEEDFINFCEEAGKSASVSSDIFAAAQGLYALNRFLAGGLMTFPIFKPRYILAVYLGMAFIFESACFATIFTLGLRGLGRHTKVGGSLIVAAISGGAAFPPMAGAVAAHLQNTGSKKPFHTAVLIPIAGFICAWVYPIYVNVFNNETMDIRRTTAVGIEGGPTEKGYALQQADSHIAGPKTHASTIEET